MSGTQQTPRQEAQADTPHIELPDNWLLAHSTDRLDTHGLAPSVVLEHAVERYTAELYLRTEATFSLIKDPTPERNGLGKWDITYVDPNGIERDGLTSFYDDPQEAVDDFTGFIQEVRASDRDRAIQQAEADDVEWPDELGGFDLVAHKSTPTAGVYEMRYIYGYNQFYGPKWQTVTARIELEDPHGAHWENEPEYVINYDATATTDPTQNDDLNARRKTSVIELASESLSEMYERNTDREQTVIDTHSDKMDKIEHERIRRKIGHRLD